MTHIKTDNIPVYKPYFTEINKQYAHDAIDSGWVSSNGKYIELLKEEFKNILGYENIVFTNNGTSATHLTALALAYKYPHIKKIIVPNNVYVAAWNSFLYDNKYELIPLDCDVHTWNTDYTNLAEHLDEETAVLIVHNIGNIINVPRLKEIYPDTIFLEDNCEGFLGKYNNFYTGTKSFASSISFYGNKSITSGEGGAFITNDPAVLKYVECVKNQGQSNKKFIHDILAYNYRMTNVQAALLYGQLNDLKTIMKQKNRVFSRYKNILGINNDIKFQLEDPNTEHSKWMFGIKIQNKDQSYIKRLASYLLLNGIDSRPMFYSINHHRHLENIPSINTNADILQSQCIILPSYPDLKDSQIDYITHKVLSFLEKS
jgi:perosamine synthetase